MKNRFLFTVIFIVYLSSVCFTQQVDPAKKVESPSESSDLSLPANTKPEITKYTDPYIFNWHWKKDQELKYTLHLYLAPESSVELLPNMLINLPLEFKVKDVDQCSATLEVKNSLPQLWESWSMGNGSFSGTVRVNCSGGIQPDSSLKAAFLLGKILPSKPVYVCDKWGMFFSEFFPLFGYTQKKGCYLECVYKGLCSNNALIGMTFYESDEKSGTPLGYGEILFDHAANKIDSVEFAIKSNLVGIMNTGGKMLMKVKVLSEK